jgi:arginyl-tRNA synthetase
MKIFLLISLLSICSFNITQDDVVYDVNITALTTKDDLAAYQKKAKEMNIELSIDYASYKDNGQIKSLQVAVSFEGFKSSSTLSFNENTCLNIHVDTSLQSDNVFSIGSCKE